MTDLGFGEQSDERCADSFAIATGQVVQSSTHSH